ncbi:hypothetical protein K2173_025897 [Erythroxylum novogranatense]|uniref:phosphoribosylglycinamide formyltransferase 1 n=1 Tax=Erythroxylum novogranatense TaxID=1862640 RepID=A0AAV8SI87_9ROSI|nr:hypothetical protein K2173_025897 [Erythroxylum novogranatense]
MEALGLLSGCSSSPTLQTSLILPMSVSSFLQRNYGNPLKIKALVALPRTAWKGSLNRLQYCNAIGKLNDSTALEVTTDREKPQLRRKRLAVFVSGGGSNFMSIHEACLQGSVHGDIVVLVTNKAGCGGAEYAKKMGIPVILFPITKHEPGGQSTSDLVSTFGRFGVDFILLAGYLKLIPVELIHAYPRSIVNIHPSLLPAFGGKGYYGMKVHKAVITSGARYVASYDDTYYSVVSL